MTKKRRLRAAAKREKDWKFNTDLAEYGHWIKQGREESAEHLRANNRGLSLDEWHRLSCMVDMMALADERWRGLFFCEAYEMQSVRIDSDLAESIGLDAIDYYFSRNLAFVPTRCLIKALEAKP